MNACDFVPQTRERMILVAARSDIKLPSGVVAKRQHAHWHTKSLARVVGDLPPQARRAWVWWQMPVPDGHGSELMDVIDPVGGVDQRWLPSAKVNEMLTKVSGKDAVRLDQAMSAGRRIAATTSGTRRDTKAGSTRVRTIRLDSIAGCLLTRATTNRQQLMVVEGAQVGIRNFTPGEMARLIGVPAG